MTCSETTTLGRWAGDHHGAGGRGDHHVGQVGGAAPEDSASSWSGPFSGGLHLQRLHLARGWDLSAVRLCHCVRSWAWTQTRPAFSKAAVLPPPVPQRVGPSRAMTEGTRGTSVWAWGSVWPPEASHTGRDSGSALRHAQARATTDPAPVVCKGTSGSRGGQEHCGMGREEHRLTQAGGGVAGAHLLPGLVLGWPWRTRPRASPTRSCLHPGGSPVTQQTSD